MRKPAAKPPLAKPQAAAPTRSAPSDQDPTDKIHHTQAGSEPTLQFLQKSP
jgi:hypothetical protein